MNDARRDGLILLLLGCVVFLFLGVVLEHAVPGPMSDFKAVYYGARCVIQHNDPYKNGEILRLYEAEGGQFPTDPIIAQSVRRAVLVCINLPTALLLVLPIAILPWGLAHLLWMSLMTGSLILGAFLMWNLGAEYAPALCGALICLVLVNSEVVVIIGNAAGIAVGLCLVAVWCFLKNRFVLVGVLCLAISLLLKPHDAGLVWLYFLLAGGVHRKRALQALLIVIVVALPAVLWVSQSSPHWIQELHSNLLQTSAHGDLNDPGPASMGAHTLGMIVSLQTVVSIFRDDPRIYNPVTYLICAPLLLIWVLVTLRSRATPRQTWLALAAISALTMLPVYHRQYDTKLLLLTVPAGVMLWAEGGLIGWLALGLNTAGFVLTGDLTWAVLLAFLRHMHFSAATPSGQLLMIVMISPVPLILLVMGVFYLWVYARRSPRFAADTDAGD